MRFGQPFQDYPPRLRWRLFRPAEPKRGVATAATLFVVYTALIYVSVVWCRDSAADTAFWPANGVAVAALIVLPPQLGVMFCAACLGVNFTENALNHLSLNLNLLFSGLNTALTFGVALLARTFCGAATDLSRIRRLAQFSAIAVIAATAEATIGDLYRAIGAHFDFRDWYMWIACDALGLIMATPATLLAVKRGRAVYAMQSGLIERWLLLVSAVALTLVSFEYGSSLSFLMIYPLLILIAFRAGAPWVSMSVMAVAIPAIALTMRGLGPIALLSGSHPFLDQDKLQLFLVSIFVCALPATNALGERNRAAKRLERIHATARDARATAEAANYAKSQFVANMSHEIRTPLNGVLGMAQVMATDALSPVQRDRLDVIRRSGESLLAILNDILDLSKIEAGKLQLEMAPFAIDELAFGAHAAFTAIAQKNGLSFDLKIEPDALGVYLGDSTRLRQIIYNLVSNALKFTERGEVRVSVAPADNGLTIKVSDTGIGIPADRLAQLFQKFEQADASTTRRFGGTGLGLSICRELAHLMGGTIAVESAAGVGSTFTVTLPLQRIDNIVSPSSPENAIEPDCVIDPARGPLRILAAEDNQVNQLVLVTLLHQLGILPSVVDDGQAAVEAWESEDWDVILMDMQMPVMDGLTATRTIRGREALNGRRRTPIIALTANVMSHQVEGYLAAGMDRFVAKPINVTQLIEAIAAVLDEGATAIAI